MSIVAKIGMEFTHARLLNAGNSPLRCRITAIRNGRVYWRQVMPDGTLGMAMYCAADSFTEKVGTVLSEAP